MRPNVLRLALFVLFACLCVGASGSAGVWLDVPFVKQEKNGCGAASIAMVMRYWQRQQGQAPTRASDAAEIQRTLYSETGRGIYASAMQRYLEQRGFRTFAFSGTTADLEQHLEKGRPLMAALKSASRGPLHYVVVVGLDSEQNLILLNDPADRKLVKLGGSKFEKEWKGTGHWMLLAVPQSEGTLSAR
jgi:ABC-type bacteriocin/lantibiotic exporter with double-glycine peptidase domain